MLVPAVAEGEQRKKAADAVVAGVVVVAAAAAAAKCDTVAVAVLAFSAFAAKPCCVDAWPSAKKI